jgi:hypothetical protein
MKKTFFILLIPLWWLFSDCSKEQPPIQAVSKDTLRCKINGRFWNATVPLDYNIISWKAGRVSTLYDSDSLHGGIWIQAIRDTTGEEQESLTISNKWGSGGRGKLRLSQVTYYGKCSSFIDTASNNWMEISNVDTAKRIIIGRFESIPSHTSCDTVIIQEGYFKLKF